MFSPIQISNTKLYTQLVRRIAKWKKMCKQISPTALLQRKDKSYGTLTAKGGQIYIFHFERKSQVYLHPILEWFNQIRF